MVGSLLVNSAEVDLSHPALWARKDLGLAAYTVIFRDGKGSGYGRGNGRGSDFDDDEGNGRGNGSGWDSLLNTLCHRLRRPHYSLPLPLPQPLPSSTHFLVVSSCDATGSNTNGLDVITLY